MRRYIMTMKLGTQTGSLINHIMSTAKARTPEIGEGATILAWTDRRRRNNSTLSSRRGTAGHIRCLRNSSGRRST